MEFPVDDSGQALALMPFDVATWTEEEARVQFQRFRWSEHGGRPTCGHCGSDAVNTHKRRRIYKCKNCFRQFSDTSGTPWAYRKLGFRKLMLVISVFADNRQAVPARTLARQLRLNYKTVLLWVHKLREAIAHHASLQQLSGDVEVDASYHGGNVRPKNVKKTQKDLRKIPYRANDRAFAVVGARQRDGSIRTCVVKEEAHARPFLCEAIAPGANVFTDMESGFKPMRGRYCLFQINHKLAYYTPEACTNAIETLWALMRVLGRTHRHIAQNYLDLYAAEAAWTLLKGKKAVGQAFAELMAWMSKPRRSPLAGYFQGRKRSLPVHRADGTIAMWKPAPRRGRADFIDKDGKVVEFKPRRTRDKTWREEWNFLSAEAFLNEPTAVPNGPGVYAFFARDETGMLTASGYVEQPNLPLWLHDGAAHIYTGETFGIRGRLLEHVRGSIRGSPLRETLLALQFDQGLLPVAPAEEHRAVVEENLTEWMRDNVVIGFKSCGYVRDMERIILTATASPMNLVRPNANDYTKGLHERRRRFRDQVVATWPAVTARAITRRRR
ncbi:IS1595 family transposase [Brevundimonas nasdae]|uniref:IS1595 family transposase n=1 Tax=Brevundimonas nasdae TaxID=172043 RepID=UPI00289FE109|nr:IS1595 family transposase [Brevundimonas nasdae]